MRIFFHVLLAVFLALPYSASADFTVDLNTGWLFRETGVASESMFATVPGTIHTDLFSNHRIADPFQGTNEASLQWIETKSWEYYTDFALDKQMLKEKHIELQLDGLDTYADVYLNDSLLFTAEDMFLAYSVDIKRFAKSTNHLRIVFHPASELIEKNKSRSTIKTYPGGDRVFIRKAQYQFGWDFGPRFVTCGIWKPVRVAGWSGMHFSDVVYKLDYLEKDTAFMTVDFVFQSDRTTKYQFLIFQNDTQTYSDFYSVTRGKPEHLKITFKVPHPKLWWCNGMGNQPLYKFTLGTFRRKKVCMVSTVTGIRKIEMSSDHLNNDGAFTFILNDVPVFVQGSNWIPSDNFLPRVPNSTISGQLNDMRDLNMNMVRVWGGGTYESDYFYSKCDSLGLLVWQDLPFACSMYPYSVLDKNGLLLKEVISNQRRIASHPSIALWCGDNENREGWYNWGWQKQFGYSSKDSAEIHNDYLNYSIKFMGCVAQHDPFFPYVTTSPQNGWGRISAYEKGDVHYWGVWWGMEPFSSYEDHTGRFVSEFGFQGTPSTHSFTQMGADVAQWLSDSTTVLHQKHPTGYETIETYMNRDYGITPKTFEDYIYLSQVMQKDAMTTAIEAQRRNMPQCMGSLFWQYNDCWPGTSWSVQDYYGRKKLAWYELKRLYQPILVSIEQTNDSVYVWVINNSSLASTAALQVFWRNFQGLSQLGITQQIMISAYNSVRYTAFAKTEMVKALAIEDGLITTHLSVSGNESFTIQANDHAIIGKEIDHNYPAAHLKYSFVRYIKEGPMAFTLSSDAYARDVMIVCDDPNTSFSVNGFDLLPGESIKVDVTTTLTEEELNKSLRFLTMNDVVGRQKRSNHTEAGD
jgi:beta-mannosidase